ncbi:MAG: glycosyltransferase [Arcicella sp.]|nr:glycosyltransferase [Arcicella sp.]
MYSPGRLGRGEALNYGITITNTELIAFQDFDDNSYPQRLEKQVSYMKKNPRVAWSCGYSYAINDFRNTSILRKLPLEHDDIVKEMVYQIPWDLTLVICRKKALTEIQKVRFINSDQEDLIMVINLIKNNWKIGNITDIIGEHFEHKTAFLTQIIHI